MVSREIPASTDLPDLFPLLDLLLCTHRRTWSLELGKHGGWCGPCSSGSSCLWWGCLCRASMLAGWGLWEDC